MIRCITIDDEPLALGQLNGYIEKTPSLELLQGFNSAIKALDFIRDNDVDLMFVDINMPDLTGLEFVKSISTPPKVIFTTAYREFAFEGFQLDAADYLVKPIGYPDFLKSVEKVKNRYFTAQKESSSINNDDQFLFIKSEFKIIRLAFNNIQFIEGMRDYIRIHLENQKPIMALSGINKILEHLPKNQFMKVHRSYIVNLNKITTIERNRIIFGKTHIPISNQFKEEFQLFLSRNFLK